MGTKLSELVAATVVAINDIFHLRTSGGIDKKITLDDILGVTTKGDLVVRGVSVPERLVAGAYGTKLTAQGAGELSLFEPVSRIRVTKNDAQSIPTATVTIVEYDDEVFDNLGEYDNAVNYRFTASKAGYYLVTAGLSSEPDSLGPQEYFEIRLYKNAAHYSTGFVNVSDAGAVYNVLHNSILNDIVYLAATEYVDIRCYHTLGGPILIITNAVYNYLAIHRLS